MGRRKLAVLPYGQANDLSLESAGTRGVSTAEEGLLCDSSDSRTVARSHLKRELIVLKLLLWRSENKENSHVRHPEAFSHKLKTSRQPNAGASHLSTLGFLPGALRILKPS